MICNEESEKSLCNNKRGRCLIMATFTKIKCLNNTGIETELTVGNTYKIISQSETEYTIQNDLTNVSVYRDRLSLLIQS